MHHYPSPGWSTGNDLSSCHTLLRSATEEKPEILAKLLIDASLSVFSPRTQDIGLNIETAPKNTAKAGTRDLSFQKYLHT